MSTTLTKPEMSLPNGEWISEPPRREVGVQLPDWYLQIQADCWHNFLETPVPVRKDEAWRFADLKKSRIERINRVDSTSDPSSIVERFRSNRVDSAIGHCLFANGLLVDSDLSRLPEGVVACEINEALAKHGELVKEHFMQDPVRLGAEKFAALHGSATLCGVFPPCARRRRDRRSDRSAPHQQWRFDWSLSSHTGGCGGKRIGFSI